MSVSENIKPINIKQMVILLSSREKCLIEGGRKTKCLWHTKLSLSVSEGERVDGADIHN